jgi:hypothetical protein
VCGGIIAVLFLDRTIWATLEKGITFLQFYQLKVNVPEMSFLEMQVAYESSMVNNSCNGTPYLALWFFPLLSDVHIT